MGKTTQNVVLYIETQSYAFVVVWSGPVSWTTIVLYHFAYWVFVLFGVSVISVVNTPVVLS